MSSAPETSETVETAEPGHLDLARRLLAATQALAEAQASGDAAAMEMALQEREEAFEVLRNRVGERPPESVAPLLREVKALDERLVAEASARQEAIRAERAQLLEARDAARRVRPEAEPRFLDVRA